MSFRPLTRNIPLLATAATCLILYGAAAGLFYDRRFVSPRVLIDFFSDNAVLGIAAIGMTYVILTGGIDLSVGSVVGLVSIVLAVSIEQLKIPAYIGIPLSLGLGLAFGLGMGVIINFFNLPPFLVTLAGMFLARGLAFVIKLESVAITSQLDQITTTLKIPLGETLEIPSTALILLCTFILGMLILRYTNFGRNIYGLGSNEQSALLMGLPVGRTRIAVYGVSGFCAALAGVVHALYTSSGNPTAGSGLELDAIAAVVIGGTLLSGGVGNISGTLIGVLIFGIIQSAIMFQGTLSSWWTKIVIGFLLLIFILLQKLLQTQKINALAKQH